MRTGHSRRSCYSSRIAASTQSGKLHIEQVVVRLCARLAVSRPAAPCWGNRKSGCSKATWFQHSPLRRKTNSRLCPDDEQTSPLGESGRLLCCEILSPRCGAGSISRRSAPHRRPPAKPRRLSPMPVRTRRRRACWGKSEEGRVGNRGGGRGRDQG